MILFAACCVVVAYLIYEPNRWIALAMTGFALGLVVRDLIQAGAEDPAKLKNGARRSDSR